VNYILTLDSQPIKSLNLEKLDKCFLNTFAASVQHTCTLKSCIELLFSRYFATP